MPTDQGLDAAAPAPAAPPVVAGASDTAVLAFGAGHPAPGVSVGLDVPVLAGAARSLAGPGGGAGLAVLAIRVDPAGDLEAATRRGYVELLQAAQARGCPHPLRLWNFVPDINRGQGDAEQYVLFNRGRAAAFAGHGLATAAYPAATAVGVAPGEPLAIVLLAGQAAPVAVENPRQTSAYRYPREYGPRPPAFARASLVPAGATEWLLISGTASIVGHASRHSGVREQVDETLANLQALVATALAARPGRVPDPEQHWRVYLRRPADLPAVRARLDVALPAPATITYLQAEICRRELLVEIEGTVRLVPGRAA